MSRLGPVGLGSAPAAAGGGVFVEAASLCRVADAGWWLQQLRESTGMALSLLESM